MSDATKTPFGFFLYIFACKTILFFFERKVIRFFEHQTKSVFIHTRRCFNLQMGINAFGYIGAIVKNIISRAYDTCSRRRPSEFSIQLKNLKKEIKLDFPAPLGPIRMLTGFGSKRFISFMLLYPLIKNDFNLIFFIFDLHRQSL